MLFYFAMGFAAAKWMLLCCEVALVCQIHFRNCEMPCGMGLLVRNHAFPLRNGFRSCQMGATVLRSGTRVPNSLSQLRNTLAAAKYTRRDFYSAAEWFGSKMLISQRFPSPCEISQSSVFPLFLLCFCSVSAPISTRFFFFSIPLKFLPPGII